MPLPVFHAPVAGARRCLSLLAALLWVSTIEAAPGVPPEAGRDATIPAPAAVLGFEPGARHPQHHEIVAYMQALAEASDRVRIENTGETHGGRPLLLAYFSRPERLQELDTLRAGRHAASREGHGPLVAWLGYSVHGNEASGASAALLMAWHLASSQSPEVLGWLDEMVIVMEPVINPDGLDRFAHWVNAHRGRHPAADPADREHHEAWPNGRTNYYWFDLNRDLMPLTHPESQARVRHYHLWRPHVVTDVHEMGIEASYFFQPGVPERNHPLMPQGNQEITAGLAEVHGEILDAAGQPYYTRESFDDYYIGKGSTYPDVTGGVGILFEQGSSRGHVVDTPWGPRSFADAIANQVRTSISTLRGARAAAGDLLDYQQAFFRDAQDQARRDRRAGWVLGDGGDPVRAGGLLDLLLGHDIDVRPLETDLDIDGQQYHAGRAWFISAKQDHYLLLRALFEVQADMPSETFYDVSAWPLQHAFNLPLATVRRAPAAGKPLQSAPNVRGGEVDQAARAWLVPWDQQRAPALLAALLAEGYRVQAATLPLTTDVPAGSREVVRGSLIVHAGIQPDDLPAVGMRLAELAQQHGVEVLAARRGLSEAGIDLGSPAAVMLDAPRIALLTGRGLNGYHAGYIWHWFDTRLQQPMTQLDWPRALGDLSRYTHVILPDGDYDDMPATFGETLVNFVQGGGQLVALRSAAQWVETLPLEWDFVDGGTGPTDAEPGRADTQEGAGRDAAGNAAEDTVADAPASTVERRPFGAFKDDRAREQVGGSVLRIELDPTHPMAFGYRAKTLSVMRRGTHRLQPVSNPYAQPATYAAQPLVAGFLSTNNRERLAGSPALVASRIGRGLVLRVADDHLFRGYWWGTETLFANAIFFGSLVGDTELPAQK